MNVPDDVWLLTRRIDSLTRAAASIRRHLHDLHVLAYEPATRDDVQVRASRTDYTPRAGDPRAQHLWSRISLQVCQVEDLLVGLERQLTAHFYARSASPEPSRGSLISRAEHDQLVANQRARRTNGEYTPVPLIDQPQHPGKGRP